jgi:hypothetical protein
MSSLCPRLPLRSLPPRSLLRSRLRRWRRSSFSFLEVRDADLLRDRLLFLAERPGLRDLRRVDDDDSFFALSLSRLPLFSSLF